LGVGGYLMGLRRTEIGTLNLKESISLEGLEKMQNKERLLLLRPVSDLTAGFNDISLSMEDVAVIKNGQELIINNKEAGYYSLFDSCGNFFGVGDLNEDCILKVKRLMSTQN
jgi:tRNA U55 pseudouridine synthase TruB